MPRFNPRLLLAALLSMIILSSCKKDSKGDPAAPSADYYMKFTVDGTDMLFVNIAEGNMNVVTGGKYTSSGGALKAANTATSNIASIVVSNNTLITTNITYTNYATNAAGFQRAAFATVSYIDASGASFNSWGDEYANTGVISNSKISFTEITTTYLKGTFSGTAYKSISGSAEKHVITNGEFKFKRR